MGPGAYEVPLKKSGPSFSIKGKKDCQQRSIIPGPGMYDPDLSKIKDKIPAPKIGNAQKPNLFNSKSTRDLPGPGNYNYLKKFGEDAQKVTILGKPQDSINNNSPGPG